MREEKAKLRGNPGDSGENPAMAYGCLFCKTGREERVAEQIRSVCPEVQTTTMRQLKYRTHNGEKCLEESLLLPSYVFFRGPAGLEPAAFPKQHLIRVLSVDGKDWQLQGDDLLFVQWLFRQRGLLGVSQACQEGDRVRILSGPLKDLEGSVRRVDRRGRSGQVVLSFRGREISVWLGFEWVAKPDGA